MAAPKGTELVPFNEYSVAKVNATDLMEILQENVGGAITEFDLQRAKVPTGGMTAWVLPSLDGEDEIVQHIDGVIVYHREPRAFWKQSIDEGGGNNPPDCSSVDGKLGVGDPGGECSVCPMAEWGSKDHGESRGQACKQMKLIFLLRPESLLPMALFLPPTSIRPVRQYAKVKLTRLSTLADDQLRNVREYSAGIRGTLDTVEVTEADVVVEGDGGTEPF
jgi:hypothetical protein